MVVRTSWRKLRPSPRRIGCAPTFTACSPYCSPAPPDSGTLGLVAALRGDATPFGAAIHALAGKARAATADAVEREYHDLFIGLGRGELLPYGSFYLTGFLHEKPLAKLRVDLDELGVARAESVPEPEDHIASLCETMQGMIMGAFGGPVGLDRQKRFFDAHIAPWARHFFSDLELAANADFYAPVGAVGRRFVDIEAEAFRMEG